MSFDPITFKLADLAIGVFKEKILDVLKKGSGINNKYALPNSVQAEEKAKGTLEAEGRRIAEDLLRQAVAAGMQLAVVEMKDRSLSGGNTAEFVGELTLQAPFVFKMDSSSKKLADEAQAIRSIKTNTSLPEQYRNSWPNIYAIRTEAPYAYLMEYFRPQDGWQSIETLLYSTEYAAIRNSSFVTEIIQDALYTMFLGFEYSVNKRQHPSILEDYVSRITERLKKTAAADPKYASLPLKINGEDYQPWLHYVSLIDKNNTKLGTITPPFTTVVHGDPNPGNLLVNTNESSRTIKFIDPKEWVTGDYLFDVCKLTHFLSVTGPVEKPEKVPPVVSFEPRLRGYEITYQINRPDWTETSIAACLKKTKKFAENLGDSNWELRYQLGMAANLLGLPLGRLEKGRSDAAAILYAEGIHWLDKFCKHLI